MTAASTHKCEVLIVGGGPTGLVLACLLGSRGVDVAVLERRTHPREYSRAIGLHPPALAVLHEIGVEATALAEGIRVHAGSAYSGGRRLGTLTFEQAWPSRPFVLTLPQNRTEEILSQRLVQLSPGALHSGWEVTDIVEDSESVQVTARAGDVQSHWHTDIVIGADGPHSLVRRRSGITTRARMLKDTYLMGDFSDYSAAGSADTENEATAAIFLESSGVVESFPLPGQMRRWVAHTGTELMTESPLALTGLIADRTGATVDPTTSTMISAFHIRRRLALRMAIGRRVIIGDAAHEVSPIGGQGMTLGWLDAWELAPILTQALVEKPSAPLQLHPGFRAFETRRIAAARATALQAELNMATGRPMHQVATVLRDAALKTVLATTMRHRLAKAFTMRKPLGGVETQVPD